MFWHRCCCPLIKSQPTGVQTAASLNYLSIDLPEIVRKRHGAPAFLNPREGLGGRIDLVVMLASRKGREFVDVLGAPMGFPRQRHKAVLNRGRLRIETHGLVAQCQQSCETPPL